MLEAITRNELLGGRLPIPEISSALGYKNPRVVRDIILKYGVPYVVIDRVIHVKPEEFRAALERNSTSTAPRGRGRPRNSATPKHEKAA